MARHLVAFQFHPDQSPGPQGTVKTGGLNLVNGAENWARDAVAVLTEGSAQRIPAAAVPAQRRCRPAGRSCHPRDSGPPPSRDVPLFVVATERDHVSPWQSVYRVHQLVRGAVTFALSSGGHNVGIVSPPTGPLAHEQASFRL